MKNSFLTLLTLSTNRITKQLLTFMYTHTCLKLLINLQEMKHILRLQSLNVTNTPICTKHIGDFNSKL